MFCFALLEVELLYILLSWTFKVVFMFLNLNSNISRCNLKKKKKLLFKIETFNHHASSMFKNCLYSKHFALCALGTEGSGQQYQERE